MSSYLDKYNVTAIRKTRFGFRVLRLWDFCAGRWWWPGGGGLAPEATLLLVSPLQTEGALQGR